MHGHLEHLDLLRQKPSNLLVFGGVVHIPSGYAIPCPTEGSDPYCEVTLGTSHWRVLELTLLADAQGTVSSLLWQLLAA